MQARIVSWQSGARWLVEGWRNFASAPVGWLQLILAYFFINAIISVVPVAGAIAVLLLYPVFTVGLMSAARVSRSGKRIELRVLFAGFGPHLRAQLLLGGVYLATLSLVLAVLVFLGGDVLRAAASSTSPSLPPESVRALGFAVLAASLVALPMFVAMWFAPVLVEWHDTGVVKALFFSFVSCGMNWRAFAVYGVLLALAGLLVGEIATQLAAAMVPDITAKKAFALAQLLVFFLMPILVGTFYASYRDVFGIEEKA